MAMSEVRATTAKQMYWPAARWRCAPPMQRSNPSSVVGGGEMNLATSSVVSDTNSDGASLNRNSRSVTIDPINVGSPVRQSVAEGIALGTGTGETTVSAAITSW